MTTTEASYEPGADVRPENTRPGKGKALLQRIIMPRPADSLDIRTLYVDEDETNTRRVKLIDRSTVSVPPSSGVSFATYFNAFPASYWRRWSILSEVVLRLRVDGQARVDVYRSKADGSIIHVTGAVFDDGDSDAHEFTLDLAPFQDGGWYWFDITTDDSSAVVHEGGWYASVDSRPAQTVSVGICTYNRPADCVAALAALGEDALVLASVTNVFVADQGDQKIVDAPGFAEAQAQLGDRLTIRNQPNFGGSGGFSRVLYEGMKNSTADNILLMDDDIVLEPDSVLRVLAFERFAKDPILVGGQMLNLQARSHLHSMGEVVDRWRFMWRAAPHVKYDHDFAQAPLRRNVCKDLHRRIDVDYNGWWMCLIPRTVVEKIGLPLPLFIKWDDAEYGLRAHDAGFPTATLPGAAIWHMAWSDKDDATDWQAYFHLRNRLVVAALYGPDPEGGALARDHLKASLKQLLSMQYSTVELQHKAINDFFAGPRNLKSLLGTAMGDIRALRSQFSDGVVVSSAQDFPPPTMDAAAVEGLLTPPTTPIPIAKTLFGSLIHNTRKVNPGNHDRPQLNVAAQDAQWFVMARLDGATVATADGRGVSFRKRDRDTFWFMMRRAVRDAKRIKAEFASMQQSYREGFADLTSVETWETLYRS